MRLRTNTQTERAGVNAARALFEAEGCVFQEIDLRNDYGKDAYVELGEAGTVSGLCVALQVKSGASYRRANGYAIPVEEHERIWREASLPVAGLVYDPDNHSLYWVNITKYLTEHSGDAVKVIPVPGTQRLDAASLREAFWPSLHASVTLGATRTTLGGLGAGVLSILGEDEELQQGGLLDVFAVGRSDARVLILLRHLLKVLSGDSLRVAIAILSCATSHPDVAWSSENWVPQAVKEAVCATFRWNEEEILLLIGSAEYDDWRRGRPGQSAFQLLVQDPDAMRKVAASVRRAFDMGDDTGATAVAVVLHLAEDQAPSEYAKLVKDEPRVLGLGGAADLERHLQEVGDVDIFG